MSEVPNNKIVQRGDSPHFQCFFFLLFIKVCCNCLTSSTFVEPLFPLFLLQNQETSVETIMKFEFCTTTNPVLEKKMAEHMPLWCTLSKVSSVENTWHLQRQLDNSSDPSKTEAATVNQENKNRK